jgi:hypothetical protein
MGSPSSHGLVEYPGLLGLLWGRWRVEPTGGTDPREGVRSFGEYQRTRTRRPSRFGSCQATRSLGQERHARHHGMHTVLPGAEVIGVAFTPDRDRSGAAPPGAAADLPVRLVDRRGR